MPEGAGGKAAERGAAETLLGVFGLPNSAQDIKQAFTGAAAAITTARAEKWYRFIATQDCHLLFAAAGNATASNMLLKAGVPEVFYMGNIARISVIRDTADGDLYLTELQIAPRDTA